MNDIRKTYFVKIPAFVQFKLELRRSDLILYHAFVGRAGYERGVCSMSRESLFELTGLSRAQITRSKKSLALPREELGGKSLITIDSSKRKSGVFPTDHIVCNDIWEESDKSGMGFILIPKIIKSHVKLSHSEYMQYVAYIWACGKGAGISRLSNTELSELTGISNVQVRRNNKILVLPREELGGKFLIKIGYAKTKDGRSSTNRVMVTDIWEENHGHFSKKKPKNQVQKEEGISWNFLENDTSENAIKICGKLVHNSAKSVYNSSITMFINKVMIRGGEHDDPGYTEKVPGHDEPLIIVLSKKREERSTFEYLFEKFEGFEEKKHIKSKGVEASPLLKKESEDFPHSLQTSRLESLSLQPVIFSSKHQKVNKKISKTPTKPNGIEEGIYLRLATLFLEGRSNFYTKFGKKIQLRQPNLHEWSKQMEKMMRIDQHTAEEIEKLIDWVQQDDFWYEKILCPRKLRKMFNQLFEEMIVKKASSSYIKKQKNNAKDLRIYENQTLTRKIFNIDKLEYKHPDSSIHLEVKSNGIFYKVKKTNRFGVIGYAEYGFKDKIMNVLNQLNWSHDG